MLNSRPRITIVYRYSSSLRWPPDWTNRTHEPNQINRKENSLGRNRTFTCSVTEPSREIHKYLYIFELFLKTISFLTFLLAFPVNCNLLTCRCRSIARWPKSRPCGGATRLENMSVRRGKSTLKFCESWRWRAVLWIKVAAQSLGVEILKLTC